MVHQSPTNWPQYNVKKPPIATPTVHLKTGRWMCELTPLKSMIVWWCEKVVFSKASWGTLNCESLHCPMQKTSGRCCSAMTLAKSTHHHPLPIGSNGPCGFPPHLSLCERSFSQLPPSLGGVNLSDRVTAQVLSLYNNMWCNPLVANDESFSRLFFNKRTIGKSDTGNQCSMTHIALGFKDP